MNSLRTLILVAALAALVPAAAPPRVDPRVIAGDAHDLVLMHPARPYRLRLHLQVDRRSFLAEYEGQMATLFGYLDRDGNGVLSQGEAAAAPSRRQMTQMLRGAATIEPDAAPAFADLKQGKDLVRLQNFAGYYDRSEAGPLVVQWANRDYQEDRVAAALWQVLDKNRNGHLSKAERDNAPRLLAALDRNEDELVTPDEVIAAASVNLPAATPRTRLAAMLPGRTIVPLRTGGAPDALIKSLLGRYDADRDGKVTRKEIGLSESAFRRLDRDGDGRLDAAELSSLGDLAPDAAVLVPLENQPRRPVELLELARSSVRTHPTRDGVWLAMTDHAIEVRRRDGRRGSPAPLPATNEVFSRVDRDTDGVLTAQEIQTPPFSYVSWLRLADRDGDGQLSRDEFSAFVDLQKRVRGAATFLRVDVEDRDLFRLLDVDQDGVLGAREIRHVEARLAPWVTGKGHLSRDMLPLQFRVTLSHGEPLVTEPGRPVRRQGQDAGPTWFRKMDRNGDGDISPKEWLGTREQFRAIDADGDGLISLDEAEAVDRKTRDR